MSGRKTDKRSHRFYGIFADPWRKLISIGLGILLWYYLNNHITQTHSDDVALVFNQKQEVRGNHIEIELKSTGFTLRRFLNGDGTRMELAAIKIELKGGNREIDEMKKPGRMKFVFRFTENDVQSTNPPMVAFRLEDIHHKTSPEYDKLLARMTPRTVWVELERNDSKNLLLTTANVELSLDETIEEGRIQAATFRPTDVDIFGPVEQIRKIGDNTRLFKVAIAAKDIKKSEIRFRLELADAFKNRGLELTLPYVIYRVEPERPHFLLVGVPIVLDKAQVSPAQGAMFEVKPPIKVDVKIGASGDLSDFLVTHIRAGENLHPVPASWSLKHARLELYLTRDDLSEDTPTARTPTLSLFKVGRNGKKELYLPGRDYILLDPLDFSVIQKRKN